MQILTNLIFFPNRTLRIAFDFHLSVGVLRISGGLDVSDLSTGVNEKIAETSRQVSDYSDYSVDSLKKHSEDNPDEIVRISAELMRKKVGFLKRPSEGNPIESRILTKMTQFRDKTQKVKIQNLNIFLKCMSRSKFAMQQNIDFRKNNIFMKFSNFPTSKMCQLIKMFKICNIGRFPRRILAL